MTGSHEFSQFERVARKVYPQSRLLRAWELMGGISAHVTALEIFPPDGSTRKVVVRQHQRANLINDANVATVEYKALEILGTAGVPIPAPILLDSTGEVFSTPYLVIEFIEGQPNFTPENLDNYLKQAATRLAEIHRIDPSKNDLGFLPDMEQQIAAKLAQKPARLDHSLEEGPIRSALEKVWPLPRTNPLGLLHGDYWPGNLLWQGEQLMAVIDWEDAKLGDPLADLGNSRMEFLWTFGTQGLETFTRYYQSLVAIDYTNLPYWELAAALRPAGYLGEWAGNPEREKIMRERHRLFVAQAFERIGQLK